jgi:hypothetical protein
MKRLSTKWILPLVFALLCLGYATINLLYHTTHYYINNIAISTLLYFIFLAIWSGIVLLIQCFFNWLYDKHVMNWDTKFIQYVKDFVDLNQWWVSSKHKIYNNKYKINYWQSENAW